MMLMGLKSQTKPSARDDSCPLSKAPTMGMWTSELELGAVEEGRRPMTPAFFYIT